MRRKLEKIRQTMKELEQKGNTPQAVTVGKLGAKTDLDAEWDNLEKTKLELREKLDKFSMDRDQLEKDLLEFKTCKEALEQSHQLTVNDFKASQAKIVQELELREHQLERKERQMRTFETDLHRREK